MLSHPSSKEFKALHIVLTQVVRVQVRFFELLYNIRTSFFQFKLKIAYLLVLQLRKVLLYLKTLLQSCHTFFVILNFTSKDDNLVLECLILNREGFDHRLSCSHLFLQIQKLPRDEQGLPQSLHMKKSLLAKAKQKRKSNLRRQNTLTPISECEMTLHH